MIKNIILLGAGQLGSRHLQALALLDEPINIEVVDPSIDNLNTAKLRFEDVEGFGKHKITYQTDIINLKDDCFEVAIIATNSKVRSKVIKELLQTKKANHFILEKVLFQSIKEYNEISELFEKSMSNAYVNCPRRMFPFYQEIKNSLDSNNPIQMEIIGNNWGLGCNSIHYIDLFNFLTGDNITSWQNNLDEGYVESRRLGYKEFYGNIFGRTTKGNSLSLTCYNIGVASASIRISNQSKRLVIEESFGKAWQSGFNENWTIEEIPFSMSYQSQLSNIVIKQLIETNTCLLTPYNVSSALHVPFIKTLLNHYNKYRDINTKVCPIT